MKRAAAVLSGAVLVIGAGLITGAGGAQAGFPCGGDNPFLEQDIWVEVGDEVYAGIDRVVNLGDPVNGPHHLWACAAATGGEANQTWVYAYVIDPAGRGEGLVAAVETNNCTLAALSSESSNTGYCNYVLAPTGAEVSAPGVTVDPPIIDGNGTTGVTSSGGGVCLYINSRTPTCQPIP